MPFTVVALRPNSGVPMYRQLYDELRQAVLTGRLAPRAKLPSTRQLSDDLEVSRNTVMLAFDQLLAEGYLEGKVGSGTYVAAQLPDDLLHARAPHPRKAAAEGACHSASKRGKMMVAAYKKPPAPSLPVLPSPFRTGLPALDAFPMDLWTRLTVRCWKRRPRELLVYGDPAGYRPLRQAVADYLKAARGVHCETEQVIIVAGSQQGLSLAARVLLDPGEAVWIEEPGYRGARGALLSAGLKLVPVPVDGEGLDVAAGIARCRDARMAYVTPSHEYPLGMMMSLPRRLALLEWAGQARAWVLEDDYNSEYRYSGRPLAALQGLDTRERVIYVGSFSKVMFPAMRLGYVVVPPDLVDAFAAARALEDWHSPLLEQAVMADFIAEGHFERHIRRMRHLYEERQQVLVEAAKRDLAGLLDVPAAEAGMHLVGWLPKSADDSAVSAYLREHGIVAAPIGAFCLEPVKHPGLLLGYAALRRRALQEGVRKMAGLLAKLK